MKTLISLIVIPLALGSAGRAAPTADGASPSCFIDVHELGPGKVSAPGVAEAHQKDLAVQDKHGVRFLEYWVDEVNGKVLCLSEAPNGDAVRETHRCAHGLLPDVVAMVKAGKE